jgi:hypothetical protein
VCSPQFRAENDGARRIRAMRLKNVLRQIQSNGANFFIDASLKWCSTPPLWHIDAVGGASTPS